MKTYNVGIYTDSIEWHVVKAKSKKEAREKAWAADIDDIDYNNQWIEYVEEV